MRFKICFRVTVFLLDAVTQIIVVILDIIMLTAVSSIFEVSIEYVLKL